MNSPQPIPFDQVLSIAANSQDKAIHRLLKDHVEFLKNPPKWFGPPSTFPLSESQALRIRGLGLQRMKKMQNLGLVKIPETDFTAFAADISNISNRLWNVLCNAQILSREACLNAIHSGRLRPHSHRSYGKKFHAALLNYFGLPPTPPSARCYCCGQVLPQKKQS